MNAKLVSTLIAATVAGTLYTAQAGAFSTVLNTAQQFSSSYQDVEKKQADCLPAIMDNRADAERTCEAAQKAATDFSTRYSNIANIAGGGAAAKPGK